MLEFSIWYFQKLATKTLRFSEDFSEERKATPFLYQLFEKENLSTSMPCFKKIPKKNFKRPKLKREL
jgi:hypothetical protein